MKIYTQCWRGFLKVRTSRLNFQIATSLSMVLRRSLTIGFHLRWWAAEEVETAILKSLTSGEVPSLVYHMASDHSHRIQISPLNRPKLSWTCNSSSTPLQKRYFFLLLGKCRESEILPNESKKRMINKIPKKRIFLVCGNWSMLPAVAKILVKKILKRKEQLQKLSCWLDWHPLDHCGTVCEV